MGRVIIEVSAAGPDRRRRIFLLELRGADPFRERQILAYHHRAARRRIEIAGNGRARGHLQRTARPTAAAHLRIATYNLGGLDENKLNNPRVGDVLEHLLPRFELIAVEGVRGKNQGVLQRLVEQINAAGSRQTAPGADVADRYLFNGGLFDRGGCLDSAHLQIVGTDEAAIADPLAQNVGDPLLRESAHRGTPAVPQLYQVTSKEPHPTDFAGALPIYAVGRALLLGAAASGEHVGGPGVRVAPGCARPGPCCPAPTGPPSPRTRRPAPHRRR